MKRRSISCFESSRLSRCSLSYSKSHKKVLVKVGKSTYALDWYRLESEVGYYLSSIMYRIVG